MLEHPKRYYVYPLPPLVPIVHSSCPECDQKAWALLSIHSKAGKWFDKSINCASSLSDTLGQCYDKKQVARGYRGSGNKEENSCD